jgi:hypothetical protein
MEFERNPQLGHAMTSEPIRRVAAAQCWANFERSTFWRKLCNAFISSSNVSAVPLSHPLHAVATEGLIAKSCQRLLRQKQRLLRRNRLAFAVTQEGPPRQQPIFRIVDVLDYSIAIRLPHHSTPFCGSVRATLTPAVIFLFRTGSFV